MRTNFKVTLATLWVTMFATAGLMMSPLSQASAVQRWSRDAKFPTQVSIEHQQWAGPIVATTNYINTTAAQTNATILTKTTFAHQPDFPRNITITPTGTTANNGTCTIVVSGTNFYGAAITENFANTATGSSAIVGAKAFKTVSSVAFPAACAAGTGVSWIVGVGSALGLKRCTDVAGKYVWSIFDGAYETSRGTLAATTAVVESNTFIPNGTMNAAKVVDLYFVQDFSCSP